MSNAFICLQGAHRHKPVIEGSKLAAATEQGIYILVQRYRQAVLTHSYLLNVLRERGQPALSEWPPSELVRLHVHLDTHIK